MLTVGVAPGTTTLNLGEIYPGVAAKSINWIKPFPDPPEEKRWMVFDRDDPRVTQVSKPNGFQGPGMRVVYSDPYAFDIYRLRGLRGLRGDTIRWDLIGIVGGGAIAVALLTSFIASVLPKKFGL